MRYNTRRAHEAIEKLEAFTTNGSLYGVMIHNGLAVYSYAEPIAFFDLDKKRVHLNTRKYSVTTGRHQTEARTAAQRLSAKGWDVDVWDCEQFAHVTQLSTRNPNPFYTFY